MRTTQRLGDRSSGRLARSRAVWVDDKLLFLGIIFSLLRVVHCGGAAAAKSCLLSQSPRAET